MDPRVLPFPDVTILCTVHSGVVTFTRKSNIAAKCPDWNASTRKLKQLVALCNGTIESQGAGMLQVDFANRYATTRFTSLH